MPISFHTFQCSFELLGVIMDCFFHSQSMIIHGARLAYLYLQISHIERLLMALVFSNQASWLITGETVLCILYSSDFVWRQAAVW